MDRYLIQIIQREEMEQDRVLPQVLGQGGLDASREAFFSTSGGLDNHGWFFS